MLSAMTKTLLPLLIIFFLFHVPAFAVKKKSYIVYLGSHSHGPEVSSLALKRVAESHHELLGTFLGSLEKARNAIFYSYGRHINGFAAVLEEEEAAAISKHPSVISVFLDKGKKLHTTHSWEFMQLEKDGVIPSSSLWSKARFGQDTIIGNIDTGVWSESQSFSSGGLGPVPSRWKGSCNTAGDVRCNRKLIGTRYFNKGYLVATGHKSNSSFESARDHEGHGTHTLSTAGGNFVPGASVFGVGNGTAKGGSPLSRVASYKACWPPFNGSECFDADILAAFDMAIHDGVDVLSVSLGGDPAEYMDDGIAIGSFHAVKQGITVVCSAGNSGPAPATVSNVAPWILTVAASTLDREFQSFVQLGNGERFKGVSMSKALPDVGRMFSLTTGAQAKLSNASAIDAMLCKEGSLDPHKAKGKIMVCLRGNTSRVDKGRQADLAGAVGMILCNDKASGNDITADPHFLPATHINYFDSQALFSYVNSTYLEPMGTLTAPVPAFGIKPAPFMADFSSQGPNTITPGILKPDVTAPGVDIIAAYTREQSLSGLEPDPRTTAFYTESGTSMSCPHVAGVAGLLRTMHPTWSSAAIRSAIMTTARTRDNRVSPMLNGSYVKANSFNYGSGHIRPNRAGDPGLVYDLTVHDYLDFLCAVGYNQTMIKLFSESPSYKCPKEATVADLNYPSITVPNFTGGSVTVTRKLKNVGTVGTYAARVREPYGVSVKVEPSVLKFDRVGQVKSFKMTLKAKWLGKDYTFGGLTWTDGKHYVRSPIVVSTA
ncbi:Subtilisin-like protease SBT5.4 [Raphanus sativus]|uniref:Subtilisin-like protease SBT5.4 n=1 Tax=Raphanus sativus TaxID=3726 RepID=A0A6J0JVP1_RAPSA|nr:subtilisin-like protease SBT5.4 [Raphanus sativus]KAJ4888533.1 Subtilisin-like protease SBT5.4 [Raphanus sativus]